MSAFEAARAQVRAQRQREARGSARRLVRRIGKSFEQVTTSIAAGEYASASKTLFEQHRLVGELQTALSAAQIDVLREQAAELFGLPTVPTADGGTAELRPAIVYCDPPWAYPTKVHAMGTHQLYDSMSDDELAALPVAGLAAEDAALLMWVTLPKLDAAHRIIEAWGFEFRAVFLVWNKVARYYGRAPRSKSLYTRPNAELLLLAIRGSMPSLKAGASNVHSNVLLTRPDDHSHKPEVVRQLIVETFGDLPRIELFARQTTPDWLAWGNEIAGSSTPSTALRSNLAQPREQKNRQTGDAIKRSLLRRKPLRDDEEEEDDDNEDTKSERRATTDRRAATKRSHSTMRYLERYEQYNELTHNKVIVVGPPDALPLEHEQTRTRFVALMNHPCVDTVQREPLSAYLSSTDLFSNSTLLPDAKPVSRSYPRLSRTALAAALPLIKTIQTQNSDIVFARANHIDPPQATATQSTADKVN
jgi:N6-adenosine-specific RNA methylase IME4